MKLTTIFRRNRSVKPETNSSSTALETNPADANVQSGKIKSAGDLLVESVERFRSDIHLIRKQLQIENEQAVAEFKAKIDHAEQLVTKTGLDHAVLSLMREMCYWPSWYQRDDFSEDENLDVFNLACEEDDTEQQETKKICFSYSDTAYCIELTREKRYQEHKKFGRIVLSSDADIFLSFRIYHDGFNHGDYSQWLIHSIEALIPGPWMAHVFELEAKMELSRDQMVAELDRNRLMELAKGLPEPE